MITHDQILELEALEQERLKALPHKLPSRELLDEYYGGKAVLQECSQDSPRGPRKQRKYDPRTDKVTQQDVYTCQYVHCDMMWTEDELVKSDAGWNKESPYITPPHAKVIPVSEQAEQRMELVCDLLGVGQQSNAGLHASLATRDARTETVAGRYAAALPHLLTALITQEVTAAAPIAVEALLSFQSEEDDHPFFTESTLYELVGKDTARSILARTRDLAKATGYQERTG